jgi:hypothetical protein
MEREGKEIMKTSDRIQVQSSPIVTCLLFDTSFYFMSQVAYCEKVKLSVAVENAMLLNGFDMLDSKRLF